MIYDICIHIFDFDDFPNKLTWSNKKETKKELNNRIEEMLDWIGM